MAIEYTLSFPERAQHYAEVHAVLPTMGHATVDLVMAVWTPGSYMVREYSRHVERLGAAALGRPLEVTKVQKNRWRVATDGAPTIELTYRVYGRELTVRTNHIERDFALINGAPTFVTLADAQAQEHRVRVMLPEGWSEVTTALSACSDGGVACFSAADFDTLVDSPLLLGAPSIERFEVGGVPHVLASIGAEGVWDGARARSAVQRIVEASRAFWGGLPYSRYVLLNLLTESYGGLEHGASCVLMSTRWATRDREDFLTWAALVSHELFHAWNVKRMRPAELGPFDYEREALTRSLWIVEGITSYYDDLLVHRAGLSTRDEYLKALSKNIERLMTTPGRREHALTESSFDAWIKLYRPDENSGNSTVSYYLKGAVVAWLLDLEVRRASAGARSLDDVMRVAYTRFSGERGYSEAQFRGLVSEVAGADLSEFLAHAVLGTDELGFDGALAWLGLRWKKAEPAPPPAGLAAEGWGSSEPAWLGAEVKGEAGRLVVARVPRQTPAHAAGLNVDDELLALDDHRVRAGELDARLKRYRPGESVSLLVARRERLVHLRAILGTKPAARWELEVDPAAPAEAAARREAWLVGTPALKA